MEDKVKAWFYDIQRAIAVERNIEIIGEAMNRITGIYPDIEISNTRKIIATRNRIIHGYDSVSEEIIWSIVINNLQVLQKEIDILLQDH